MAARRGAVGPWSATANRPHNVQHIDPATGAISKIVAVPAARYEGNEDGRGGFGALQYEQVMGQYKQFNTDPEFKKVVGRSQPVDRLEPRP